jgi:hypothetical protein
MDGSKQNNGLEAISVSVTKRHWHSLRIKKYQRCTDNEGVDFPSGKMTISIFAEVMTHQHLQRERGETGRTNLKELLSARRQTRSASVLNN